MQRIAIRTPDEATYDWAHRLIKEAGIPLHPGFLVRTWGGGDIEWVHITNGGYWDCECRWGGFTELASVPEIIKHIKNWKKEPEPPTRGLAIDVGEAVYPLAQKYLTPAQIEELYMERVIGSEPVGRHENNGTFRSDFGDMCLLREGEVCEKCWLEERKDNPCKEDASPEKESDPVPKETP